WRRKDESGRAFPPRPYRPEKPLRLGDGHLPQSLDYKDFVELDKVRNEKGKALALGQKLEYWLEAVDNCDYPGPNIGESKHFHVTIEPPVADDKKDKANRQRARHEPQQPEAQQDRKPEPQ